MNIVKTLLDKGETENAILRLDSLIAATPDDDALYYMRGNAYRKQGNWKQAIENYLEAKELNPQSPATEAYKMVMDILDFYNKEVYNQ